MKRKVTRLVALLAFMLFLFPLISFAEKIVVIDPGHGGKFSGTCGYSGNSTGFCEKNANLLVALKLRDILKSTDIKVQLTRSTDTAFASYLRDAGGDFENRMKVANDFAKGNNDNSIFISIHHNAHPSSTFTRGIETYYYDGVNHYKSDWPPDPMQLTFLQDSKRLAEVAHPGLISKLGLIDRKIRNDQSFYVIRNAQMPSILVELGFMTHPTEEQLIKSNAFQQNAAQSLADSAINYFKVFEVFDATNKKLKTFEKKADAISYAEGFKSKVTVFDKDMQKVIFTTQPEFEVQHQINGPLKKFYTLADATNYAKLQGKTRIISLGTKWTIWSNFLSKKYDVYINNVKTDSFYDYNYANNHAKSKTNAKIVNNLTGDVLWTNQSNVTVTRNLSPNKLAGQTRYITAVEISKSLYPNGFPMEKEQKTVILATGEDSADGLSAGPLSTVYGVAPILLTKTAEFTEATKNEILRLKADKVVIVGGHLAIKEEVEAEINALEIETVRISGPTRYDTNQLIIDELGELEGIFVASGASFADAIAAAPIAAANNWGILLTPKNDISDDALKVLTGKRVVILGGHLVLSDQVETKINNYPHKKSVERLAGTNRYDTVAMLLRTFKNEINSNQIILTTGTNFPDALASAALAIHSKAPIILVEDNLATSVELFLMEYGETNYLEDIFIIGEIVKDSVITQVTNTVR